MRQLCQDRVLFHRRVPKNPGTEHRVPKILLFLFYHVHVLYSCLNLAILNNCTRLNCVVFKVPDFQVPEILETSKFVLERTATPTIFLKIRTLS